MRSPSHRAVAGAAVRAGTCVCARACAFAFEFMCVTVPGDAVGYQRQSRGRKEKPQTDPTP